MEHGAWSIERFSRILNLPEINAPGFTIHSTAKSMGHREWEASPEFSFSPKIKAPGLLFLFLCYLANIRST